MIDLIESSSADIRVTALLDDLRSDMESTAKQICRRHGVGYERALRLMRAYGVDRWSIRYAAAVAGRRELDDDVVDQAAKRWGVPASLAALRLWATGSAVVEPPFEWVGSGAAYPWEVRA